MKYWAFLSYSHTDKKWGDWLHKALETYRVPRRLIGKESRDGKIPQRVYPIFRDREELPVSADLGSNINEALRESRYLIVVCSPRSAQSRWVGEEIETFKKLGREDRIFALIVDGEPNASDGKPGFKVEDECFHEAMRYRMADGEVSEIRSEPIAGDAREGKDGKTNAKLKLLAGLLGVNYDDLKQREQERRLRRARIVVALSLVLIGVFAALSVALFFARSRAVQAEQQTRLRASKADADIALQLGGRDEPYAFAHAVRALELNPNNTIASILAYRLLGDGPLTLPTHLFTHSSVVRAVGFSRDGRSLATGCDDGSMMVADLETGEKFTLKENWPASVVKLAFSPDGQSVAVATGDEAGEKPAVHTWQFKTLNKPVLVSENFTWGVLEVDWPLQDRIVAYSGRDWGSGDQLTQVFGPAERGWNVVFGVGDSFVFEGDQEVDVTNIARCDRFQTWVSEEPATLVVQDMKKHRLLWFDLHGTRNINKPLFAINTMEGDIVDIAQRSGIAIIGTGFTDKLQWRRFADETSGPKRRSVLKWVDPRSRKQGTIQLYEDTLVDRISGNGGRLLAVKRDAAVILDRQTGEQLASVQVKNKDPEDLLDFTSGGDSLVVRSELNRIVLGELDNEGSLQEIRVSLPARVTNANVDPSGKWLVTSSDDRNARVWRRVALRQKPLALSGGAPKADPDTQDTFDASEDSADANYQLNITEGENVVHLDVCRMDQKTKQCVYLSSLQKPEEPTELVTGHSFSPDGSRIAVTYGSWSSRPDNNAPSVAILFDTATGRIIGEPLQHDDDVFSPCYASNGKWFVTVSDDRTVRRWEGQSGAPIGEPLRLLFGQRFAQVSPNSELVLTGSGDLIDATRWQLAKKLPNDVLIKRAFFSPDGLWLTTISDTWQRNDESPWLIELNQWDLQNAVRISGPIEVSLGRKVPERRYRSSWQEPGRRIVIGSDLIWQCTLPCPVENILPFLQACRPLVLGETGEQVVNSNCSLDSLSIENFFPQGRTPQNQAAYDFADRVLNRGAMDAQR